MAKKNDTVSRVKSLLIGEGLGVEDVVKKVGVSRKRIYEIVTKHSLPTNPSVYPGGKTELQICNLLACGWAKADVAASFRMSEAFLNRVIDAARIRLRKEMEDAKGRGDRGGHEGKEAPALPRNPRPSRSKRSAKKSPKPRRKTSRRKKKA